MPAWTLTPVGDAAVVLDFEPIIDPVVNARALGIADSLRDAALPGVRDVVESYCSVTVHFDPLRTDVGSVTATLETLASSLPSGVRTGREVTVPVCYGGELGPDLDDVARFAGCLASEVVAIHTSVTYRVYMLGFQPGFPYLGSVDPRIGMPRRETVRMRVPAGSVGIAAGQTGVYPCEAPGGWRLIGRTAVHMFDLDRPSPYLVRAGDAVRFEAIDVTTYNGMVTAG